MGYDKNYCSSKYITTHASAVQLHNHFNLVGGSDPDLKKRIEFERKYRKPAYSCATKLVRKFNPDIVIIASPTCKHKKSLEDALKSKKISTVLCEKPLSESFSESEKIVKTCQKNKIKLFVNFIRRADPGIIEVKRRITRGKIRGPLKAVVWYSKGLLHNGSHFLDLMTYWLGPIRRAGSIFPTLKRQNTHSEPNCCFEFKLGSAVFLSAKEKNFTHYTVEIVAQNGRLQVDSTGAIFWQKVEHHPYLQGYRRLAVAREIIPTDINRYQLNVMKQLERVLSGKPSQICTGAEALLAQKWIEKVLGSES